MWNPSDDLKYIDLSLVTSWAFSCTTVSLSFEFSTIDSDPYVFHRFNVSRQSKTDFHLKFKIYIFNTNPQVIHATPVHQLMYCEAKGCVFIKKKKIKVF